MYGVGDGQQSISADKSSQIPAIGKGAVQGLSRMKCIWTLILACLALMPTVAFAADNPADANGASSLVTQNSSGSAAADPNRPVRDKWAIVIGISNFEKDSVPQLKFAAKDAKDFYDFLIKDAHFAPDHVRLLLNEKATRKRILSELGNRFLARVADKDDLIVLYISTHGSPSELDVRHKNYIVAYDSDPEDLYATSIEMQEIADSISDRVLSDRVLLVLDACHSGGITPVGKGITRTANFDVAPIAMGSGQMVISSSEPDQQSWESKRYQNGVFTKRLLEAMRGSEGQVPISKAFEDAAVMVQREVKEDYPGMRQKPVMNSKWRGDNLVIAIKPAQPQVIPDSVMSVLDKDSAGYGTRISRPDNEIKGAQRPVPTPSTNEPSSEQSEQSERRARNLPDVNEVAAGTTSGVMKINAAYFSNVEDPAAAYTAACQAQAAHFNDTDYYFRKAKILIQLGKWGKAMQELKGCIVDNPQVPQYYLARAYCFFKLGQKAQSEADLRQYKFLDVNVRDKLIELE